MEDEDQNIMAANHDSTKVYVIGGSLLFLATCAILLHLCASSSSSSARKKRRQVKDSELDSLKRPGNNVTHNRKWRESQTKRTKKKVGVVVADFPVITIVITPPSPQPSGRISNNDDDFSSDVIPATTTSENSPNGVKPHDLTRGDDDVSCQNGENKMASSTTSLSGIGDVNFEMTSEEVTSSERGGEEEEEELQPEEVIEPRPRLPSMEPDASKADYRIIVVDRCQGEKS